MKKTALIITTFVLLAILTAGGFFYQRSQPKFLEKVTYGFIAFPGTLPYLVAKDQGFFQEEGVDVEIVDDTDYVKMNEDVATGAVDFQSQYVLIDVVDAVSRGKKLSIVMATDYSDGADAIVAKKEIRTVADLKGKKIGVAKGTLSQYLLSDALKKSSLSLSDVIEVDLTSADAVSAFISGDVDAAVSWEPDVTKAVTDGGGWRLYTSAESPGLIIDCLVFRSEFVRKYPKKVTGVIRGYMKGMNFISANPEKSYEIGAAYMKVSAAEFRKQMKGVKLMTKDDNLNLMKYGPGFASLHGSINRAYQFLNGIGTITNPVDSTQIIDPGFVRELNK